MSSETWVIHFGVYPRHPEDEVVFFNHRDSTESVTVESTAVRGTQALDIEFEIEGSWKCWGTADQSTDGDNSLHAWFYVNPEWLYSSYKMSQFEAIHDHLEANAFRHGCRVLDYAVLTEEDWSEVVGVMTFVGSGTYFHPVRDGADVL